MPTYEYECKACHHRFDLFQSMSDPHKRKCPKCGKNTLERLIGTGAALIFKGSGFYQTDYRTESYKKSAEADKKPSESKPDSKPTETKASDSSSARPGAPTKSADAVPAPKPTEPKPAKADAPKPAKGKSKH